MICNNDFRVLQLGDKLELKGRGMLWTQVLLRLQHRQGR